MGVAMPDGLEDRCPFGCFASYGHMTDEHAACQLVAYLMGDERR